MFVPPCGSCVSWTKPVTPEFPTVTRSAFTWCSAAEPALTARSTISAASDSVAFRFGMGSLHRGRIPGPSPDVWQSTRPETSPDGAFPLLLSSVDQGLLAQPVPDEGDGTATKYSRCG